MHDWSIDDEKVAEFENTCLKPFFPHCRPASVSAFGAGDVKKFGYAHIELSDDHNHIKGTPYEYKKPYLFLHYTSLNSLFSILKEGKIRMYNLQSMDDKHELNYAVDKLELKYRDEWEREWMNDGYYALSMVERDVETSKKSLDLWRRYGNDGKGVAIEFKFATRYRWEWNSFYLSKVLYGDSEFDFLLRWRNSIKKFEKETGFQIQGQNKMLHQLKAYHKRYPYHTEKEVRLIYSLQGLTTINETKLQKSKKSYERIHPDASRFSSPTDYFELELDYQKNRSFPNFSRVEEKFIKRIYPQVSISKIIFGYRIRRSEAYELYTHLGEHYKDKYPQIQFEDSTLTADF